MYTATYYRFGNRWFLDYPDYLDKGIAEEDLERVGVFKEFLNCLSENEDTVVLQMDIKPFDGADCLELIASSGGKTGGYYKISSYKGGPCDNEIWFNSILYTIHSELPERIYFKKVKCPVVSS